MVVRNVLIVIRDEYLMHVHKIHTERAFSLHVKLGHPSKGQLVSLMSRYFYCHGGVAIIQAVADNCVQCRSMQPIPKEFTMDSTEKIEAFGTRFAVDVIERFELNEVEKERVIQLLCVVGDDNGRFA